MSVVCGKTRKFFTREDNRKAWRKAELKIRGTKETGLRVALLKKSKKGGWLQETECMKSRAEDSCWVEIICQGDESVFNWGSVRLTFVTLIEEWSTGSTVGSTGVKYRWLNWFNRWPTRAHKDLFEHNKPEERPNSFLPLFPTDLRVVSLRWERWK